MGWAVAGSDAVLVNDGFLYAGILLAIIGVYHLLAGFDLDVDERDALVAAGRQVDFAVGHKRPPSSAGGGFAAARPGASSVNSSEEPPANRGLVLVDGCEGRCRQHFVEDNPEDWSDLPAAEVRPEPQADPGPPPPELVARGHTLGDVGPQVRPLGVPPPQLVGRGPPAVP